MYGLVGGCRIELPHHRVFQVDKTWTIHMCLRNGWRGLNGRKTGGTAAPGKVGSGTHPCHLTYGAGWARMGNEDVEIEDHCHADWYLRGGPRSASLGGRGSGEARISAATKPCSVGTNRG